METPLLTLDEVAAELNAHPNTIYRYIDQNKIKAIKMEGMYRFRRSDIDEFLKNRETIGKGE